MTYSETETIVAWLRSAQLCEGLDNEHLAMIASQVRVQSFAARETLALANEVVTDFWIVVDGEIDSFLTDPRGRERLLGVVRAGESVGEVAILEKSPRAVRFTARTTGTLLVAPAATFLSWLEACPPLMRNLFRTLTQRFKEVAGITSRHLPSPRLGIFASSTRGRILAGRLATRLMSAGERLEIWSEDPTALKSLNEWPAALPIQELLPKHRPLEHPPSPGIDRRIVIWTRALDRPSDIGQILNCDELLWLLEPREAVATSQDLRRLPDIQDELLKKVRLVWLLDGNTPVAPHWLGLELQRANLKVPVESTGGKLTRLESQGLDRLVRAMRGYSIGIALAGGGAKGMAHFGALRVLEDAGLSCDVMSGTSVGAMAGILYSSGMSPDAAVENFQRDLTPSRLFRMMPKWPNWYLVSKYRRRAWEGMLRRYLYDWRLEQLAIPFNAVTVDLVQVRTVVRRQGDAVNAILESINLPVVSRPILRDGMVLVDGGVLNNLPADVLVEGGADFVIGVDVSSHVRPEFAGNRPEMPTDRMRPAGTFDTLFRIFESQAHNLGKIRNQAVDFWISPDTSGFGLAEFHRTAEIADAGEAAASIKVEELKKRLEELEIRLLGLPVKSNS